MDFFEETKKALKEAVAIERGEISVIEAADMPAKTLRAVGAEEVGRAAELSRKLFEGKKDLAGVAYYKHPKAVAALVDTDTEKIVAYLHDVLEDTDYPEEEIRREFGDAVADAVLLLTHKGRLNEAEYLEYIRKLKESGNKVAINVKIADLMHNSDIRRLGVDNADELKPKDRRRYMKYQEAIRILRE